MTMDVDAFFKEEADSWAGLLTRFDRLSEQAWDTPGATGEWTPKGVLAHIAGWHRHCADLLATYARGIDPRTPFTKALIDEMNAGFVATFQSWDSASVRLLAKEEHVRVVVGIRASSFRTFDESWETLIRENTTAHYDEHRPLLDAFIKEHA